MAKAATLQTLLQTCKVEAGFPSFSEEYIEESLDPLNRYLIKHPAATFFIRVSSIIQC